MPALAVPPRHPPKVRVNAAADVAGAAAGAVADRRQR
jgi:hypothetical protein